MLRRMMPSARNRLRRRAMAEADRATTGGKLIRGAGIVALDFVQQRPVQRVEHFAHGARFWHGAPETCAHGRSRHPYHADRPAHGASAMRPLLYCLLLGAAASCAAAPDTPDRSPVQAPNSVHPPFSIEDARQVIPALATLLIDNYVFPDTGKQYAEVLQSNLAAGRYNSFADAGAFAEFVTADLQAVSSRSASRARRAEDGQAVSGTDIHDRVRRPAAFGQDGVDRAWRGLRGVSQLFQ